MHFPRSALPTTEINLGENNDTLFNYPVWWIRQAEALL
jgi:hypothetical protein